jgi:ubiquinone/menaquinone biosynthesis C-methylase UbiE
MEGVPADYYDLVYCFATMEHVPRIDLAFSEMVRVTRAGGIIYTFSSPLWNSRYGDHRKDMFRDPWIHLRYGRDEIILYCTSRGLRSVYDGRTLGAIVAYIFNRKFFNRVSAKTYVEVCNRLQRIQIIKNVLFFEEPSVLSQALKSELFQKGYPEEELLAVSHKCVARKL